MKVVVSRAELFTGAKETPLDIYHKIDCACIEKMHFACKHHASQSESLSGARLQRSV